MTRGSILVFLSPFVVIQARRLLRGKSLPQAQDAFIAEVSSLAGRARSLFVSLTGWEQVLVIALAALCGYVLFICLLLPLHSWDAISTWAFKAKVIFYNKTIFVEDFLDPARFSPLTSYPLLVPLSENYIFNMVGELNEHCVKIIFALLYSVLVLNVYWASIIKPRH